MSEIVAQSPDGTSGLTVLFCSINYDLGRLGRALHAAGRDNVIGAAASRAIGRGGFFAKGITGFHLPAGRFKVADALIDDAASFGLPDARSLVRTLREQLDNGERLPHRFGMLLIDVEPRCEERLTAALAMELAGVPIVGGSAGDLYFNPLGHAPGSTRILHRGRALRGAAVFSLVATESPVCAVSHNLYTPGRRRLVVTEADPERRVVRELDGRRALETYAAACGLKKQRPRANDFAPYPLMIRIGGQYFARGVQRVYDDGTLEFACAIEPGMVVTLGRAGDMVARLREMFEAMKAEIGAPELVVGFDCAARTADMEQCGLTGPVAALFAEHAVIGFSTLGEQFNTIHVNNSFTCVGIGAAK